MVPGGSVQYKLRKSGDKKQNFVENDKGAGRSLWRLFCFYLGGTQRIAHPLTLPGLGRSTRGQFAEYEAKNAAYAVGRCRSTASIQRNAHSSWRA